MSVIANTTVVSNFASVGEVELLRRLFGELYLTVQVYREIQAGLEEGYEFYSALEGLIHPITPGGWIRLTSLTDQQEIRLFSGMPMQLHEGEGSSLAVAQNRGWLFLTDDKAARRAAIARQVRISGTLGCLALSVEKGFCTVPQANQILERVVDSGFYSPVADVTSLLKGP